MHNSCLENQQGGPSTCVRREVGRDVTEYRLNYHVPCSTILLTQELRCVH